MVSTPQFNFGANWKDYSKGALDAEKFEAAKISLDRLIGTEQLQGASFLDIGCGSGIFALAASILGASPVKGVDVNPESIEAATENAKRFGVTSVTFSQFDILSPHASNLGMFDIVYSWGVLHHTGNMQEAIRHAASLVKPGGLFVLAIYRTHWSSPLWKLIKIAYNHAPRFLKRLMVVLFFAVIATAKFLVTRKNPFQKKRGMTFYYDVVDWLGGYPYEYASAKEIQDLVEPLGFHLERLDPAVVPTGCDEFVFVRK